MQNDNKFSQKQKSLEPLPMIAHVMFWLLLGVLFFHRTIPRTCEVPASALLDRFSVVSR